MPISIGLWSLRFINLRFLSSLLFIRQRTASMRNISRAFMVLRRFFLNYLIARFENQVTQPSRRVEIGTIRQNSVYFIATSCHHISGVLTQFEIIRDKRFLFSCQESLERCKKCFCHRSSNFVILKFSVLVYAQLPQAIRKLVYIRLL